MIEGFDTRTLTVIITLLAIIHGIALCCYARTHESFHGFWEIGTGFLIIALGFGLISFRAYITDWVTIVLSGAFIVYAIKLIGVGLLRFFDSPFEHYQKTCHLLLLLQILTFVYFSVVEFNSQWRISIICTVLSIQCFYLSHKLLQIKEEHHHLSVRLLNSLFILFGLVFIARAIWTIMYYSETSIDPKTIAHISSLMVFFLLIVASSSIVIWSASVRLQNELHRQATIDLLTQIYNRRALETIAQKEFARSKRENKPFSLVLIDIDWFKNINDQYGHQFGDHVLVQFCKLITKNLRPYDVFARYGGEEFVLLLPNTNANDALKISEKLRKIISNAQFSSSTISIDQSITASFGVTESDGDNIHWEHQLSKADKALYQAKQKGRNQVVEYTLEVECQRL